MTELLPYLISAACGGVVAMIGLPMLARLKQNAKPRAAKQAVDAVANLVQTLNERDDEDDGPKRRKAELDIQLHKLADLTSGLSKKAD